MKPNHALPSFGTRPLTIRRTFDQLIENLAALWLEDFDDMRAGVNGVERRNARWPSLSSGLYGPLP